MCDWVPGNAGFRAAELAPAGTGLGLLNRASHALLRGLVLTPGGRVSAHAELDWFAVGLDTPTGC